MTTRFETAGPACAKNPSLPIKRAALCYLNFRSNQLARQKRSIRALLGRSFLGTSRRSFQVISARIWCEYRMNFPPEVRGPIDRYSGSPHHIAWPRPGRRLSSPSVRSDSAVDHIDWSFACPFGLLLEEAKELRPELFVLPHLVPILDWRKTSAHDDKNGRSLWGWLKTHSLRARITTPSSSELMGSTPASAVPFSA